MLLFFQLLNAKEVHNGIMSILTLPIDLKVGDLEWFIAFLI